MAYLKQNLSEYSSGQYWDSPIDYASYLNDKTTMILGVDANAAQRFALATNNAFATQQSGFTGPFPIWQSINDGSGIAFNMFGPSGGIPWVFVGAWRFKRRIMDAMDP